MPRSDHSSDSSSNASYDSDEDYRLAQKEWNESLEELQQLALVLLLPWVGKYFGRKCSYWRMYKRIASVYTNEDVSCSVRSLHSCRSRQVVFHGRETFGMDILLAMNDCVLYYRYVYVRHKTLLLTSSSKLSVVEFYQSGSPMPRPV